MSKIKSMRIDDVSYDIGANYSNIDGVPTFKTINNQSILGSGNINIGGGGSGTTDYSELSNKPSINNVTLSGNKALSDLGIQAAGDYALSSDIPTKVSDLANDSGFITGYTETDPTVPSHVKNITQENITSWNNKSNFSGNYNDLTNKPTIPSQVTEATVSGWGFTKNTGTYSKPSGGIPKSDLASAVQASLNKADSALQTEQYTGTYSKPSGGIPKSDLASAVQTSLDKADTALQQHQDISGKQNVLVSGENIKTINNQSILGQGNITIESSSGTLPEFEEDHAVPSSGATFQPVDLSYLVETVDGENWKWSGNSGEASGWWRTNKLEFIPGYTYRFVNFPRNMYQYGETGASGTTADLGASRDVTYTIPDGVYYIGFYANGTMRTGLEMYRVTPTPEESAALEEPNLKADHFSLTLQNFKTSSVINPIVPLKGKTIVNFGDSIFGNFYAPYDVSSYLASFTGANVYNCGFGGNTMAIHRNANYGLFSFPSLVDAIVGNDWSAQDTALASSWEAPETYSARLATLKSIDFSKVDIITVAFGTNDWNFSYPLDNEQNPKDTLTYCGGFRYSIEKLLTAFPQIRVFTCTPIFRTHLDENYQVIEYSDTWANGNGKKLPDFAAALKDLSAEYNIKCIDNYYETCFNKLNRTLYYRPNDGTHPNEAGRKVIAFNIANGITSSGAGWGGKTVRPDEISDMATKTWVGQQGYLTLSDLPIYNGGVN